MLASKFLVVAMLVLMFFFVISGFLITNIIIGEMEQDKFSILRFYERRARRILPALFFVMLCCIPFAYLWMTPDQYQDFTSSIVAVCLFVSNILFWRESDYFAPASEEKPLLHTWSLAVEEQYYMFFPIFLMIFWRFGRQPVFYSIIMIAVISLLISEWGWRNSPIANFYLAPTRVWELLAGSICAFLQVGKNKRKSNFLSSLGLALILFSIFFYTADTPFPSFYTLIPVLGTSLLILYGVQGTLCAHILSLRPFVGVGLISYSAYLWHQPLFAFARIRSVSIPQEELMLALALLSIILAYLSWRFIEQPFRKKNVSILVSRQTIFGASALCATIFITFGLISNNTTHYKNSLPPRAYEFYQVSQYGKTNDYYKQFREMTCFYSGQKHSFQTYKKAKCLSISPSKKNYMIVGDSHAAHFWYAMNQVFPEHNILQATASGCRPLLKPAGRKECTKLMNYIFEDFIRINKIDGVILSAQWRRNETEQLLSTIEYLNEYVDKVIVIGPTIEYQRELPILLATHSEKTNKELSYLMTRYVREDTRITDNKLNSMLIDSHATYIRLSEQVCSDSRCTVFTDDGVPMLFDESHFTISGSIKIIKDMKRKNILVLD